MENHAIRLIDQQLSHDDILLGITIPDDQPATISIIEEGQNRRLIINLNSAVKIHKNTVTPCRTQD